MTNAFEPFGPLQKTTRMTYVTEHDIGMCLPVPTLQLESAEFNHNLFNDTMEEVVRRCLPGLGIMVLHLYNLRRMGNFKTAAEDVIVLDSALRAIALDIDRRFPSQASYLFYKEP